MGLPVLVVVFSMMIRSDLTYYVAYPTFVGCLVLMRKSKNKEIPCKAKVKARGKPKEVDTKDKE